MRQRLAQAGAALSIFKSSIFHRLYQADVVANTPRTGIFTIRRVADSFRCVSLICKHQKNNGHGACANPCNVPVMLPLLDFRSSAHLHSPKTFEIRNPSFPPAWKAVTHFCGLGSHGVLLGFRPALFG
jgi:hypothetical protein